METAGSETSLPLPPAVVEQLEEHREDLRRWMRAREVDAEQIERLKSLAAGWNVPAIARHVRDAVAAAPLLIDPFPHLVIEPLLPEPAFRTLVDSVPSDEFFEGGRHLNLRGLGLPNCPVPLVTFLVWRSLRYEIIGAVLGPAIAERFRPHAREFLRISVGPEFVDEALALPLHPHGHRVMLRRPPWQLAPHLDPRDQFISTLLYLAKPGEPEGFGTQLFRVHQENFVAGWANTYYPEEEGLKCELAKTMPFRGNLCVSMLNLGGGAHGAALPADAPADMRRLVFQFYMGPDREKLDALIDRLPAERQLPWRRRVKSKGADKKAMA
jgi:hypothetical protein